MQLHPIGAIFRGEAEARRAAAALREVGVGEDAVALEVLPRPLFGALRPLGVSDAEAATLESRIEAGNVLLRVNAADPAAVATLLTEAGGLLVRGQG